MSQLIGRIYVPLPVSRSGISQFNPRDLSGLSSDCVGTDGTVEIGMAVVLRETGRIAVHPLADVRGKRDDIGPLARHRAQRTVTGRVHCRAGPAANFSAIAGHSPTQTPFSPSGRLAHQRRQAGARKLRPVARNEMTVLARTLTETADRRGWCDFGRPVGWRPRSLWFEYIKSSRTTLKGRTEQHPLCGLPRHPDWGSSGANQRETIFCLRNEVPIFGVNREKIIPSPEIKTSKIGCKKYKLDASP